MLQTAAYSTASWQRSPAGGSGFEPDVSDITVPSATDLSSNAVSLKFCYSPGPRCAAVQYRHQNAVATIQKALWLSSFNKMELM